MDQYILISSLNDFIFCPKSIYFHRLYEPYEQEMYHSTYQVNWNIAHSKVDKKDYSTSKDILQSKMVFSEKYWLVWKIDLFHIWKKSLIERKAHISKVVEAGALDYMRQIKKIFDPKNILNPYKIF